MLLTSLLVLLSFTPAPTFSLSVVTGSPCYTSCNGDSTTQSTNLICSDNDYNTTASGQQIQSCLTCESTSLFTNQTDSDEYWLLFNMKYTAQTCLFDSSTKTSQVDICAAACEPLQPVLDTLWLSTIPKAGQYDYCSLDSGAFPENAASCASCLQGQAGSVVLGNFISTLSTACNNQPLALNGQLVVPAQSVFDTTSFSNNSSAANGSSSTSSVRENSTSTAHHSSTPSAPLTSSSTNRSSKHMTSTTFSDASSTTSPNISTTNSNLAGSSQTQNLSKGTTIGYNILSTVVAFLALCLIAALLAFCLLRRRRRNLRKIHWRKTSVSDVTPPVTGNHNTIKDPRVDSATGADLELKNDPEHEDLTLRYYPSASEVPPTPTTLTPTPLPTPKPIAAKLITIRHAPNSSPPVLLAQSPDPSYYKDLNDDYDDDDNDDDDNDNDNNENDEVLSFPTLPASTYQQQHHPQSYTTRTLNQNQNQNQAHSRPRSRSRSRPRRNPDRPFWSSSIGSNYRSNYRLNPNHRRQPSSPGSPPPPRATRVSDKAPPLPRVSSKGFIVTPGHAGTGVVGLGVGKKAPPVAGDVGTGTEGERGRKGWGAVSTVSSGDGGAEGWNDRSGHGNVGGNYYTNNTANWTAVGSPVSMLSEFE